MATYVNDLRLKEIGTGESSGTWGSETNTNLELIGEALGFGTEAITTNADTHTTTVADGSTDPGRAMYIKYTGTLDSACTITIAPNTMSRMHFIENGTSGSQNIIISQGTGANVTIPAGDVKAVYLDGAGSGAAVTDAFASLNVVDLKVEDDLTVTDDATIGGTLGVTGAVTANAGVSIDNITIDGTEIDLSSGDLTLDVAGDIILDADGSTITMKDGGTTRITFNLDATPDLVMAGGNASITASTSDADLSFIGNDGGSDVTALTLDMSNAGAANFNAGISIGGTEVINSSRNLVNITNLVVDELDIGGDTITASDDFIIDAAADITLDAAGQQIIFKSSGTSVGQIDMGGTDLEIKSLVSNADFFIRGNDGGSEIDALTFDMSAAGVATFNSHVNVGGIGHVSLSGSASEVSVGVSGDTDNSGGGVSFAHNTSTLNSYVLGQKQSMTVGSAISTPLIFVTNNTERVRISTEGDLYINTTVVQGQGGCTFDVGSRGINQTFNQSSHVDGNEFITFRNTNTQIGSITANTSSSISYNTSSDARLKDIIGKARGLEVIKQLNPVSFNWKADGKADEGLIAQEVLDIVPNAVSGSEEEYYQMDYSKLVTPLVKAIQEQQEQIDALQSEIQQPKGE